MSATRDACSVTPALLEFETRVVPISRSLVDSGNYQELPFCSVSGLFFSQTMEQNGNKMPRSAKEG